MIALDAVREEKKVIRDRLWVHSVDPNDAFCIMYLKNRGWGVSGDTFSVDFTATGAASGSDADFECSLNRAAPEKCKPLFTMTKSKESLLITCRSQSLCFEWALSWKTSRKSSSYWLWERLQSLEQEIHYFQRISSNLLLLLGPLL